MASYPIQKAQKHEDTKVNVEKPQIDYMKRTKQLICGVRIFSVSQDNLF